MQSWFGLDPMSYSPPAVDRLKYALIINTSKSLNIVVARNIFSRSFSKNSHRSFKENTPVIKSGCECARQNSVITWTLNYRHKMSKDASYLYSAKGWR